MAETKRTTSEEARRVGDEIGVDWSRFDFGAIPVWHGRRVRTWVARPADGRHRRRPDPDRQDRTRAHVGVSRLLRAPQADGGGSGTRLGCQEIMTVA